jgi:spore coat protein SA
MSRKICFVTNGAYPVPDMRGGAIEHLLTLFISENEKFRLFDVTIITMSDKNAILKQGKYKYTDFVNIKCGGNTIRFIVWKIIGVLKKLGVENADKFQLFEYLTVKYLLKHGNKYDLIINEGFAPLLLLPIAKKYGSNKMGLHIHYHYLPSPDIDNIYGHAFAISKFVAREFAKSSIMKDSNIKVVYNGIDLQNFNISLSSEKKQQLRKTLGIGNLDFVCVFCGRIISVKGILQLCEAVIDINDNNVKLLIIGSSDFANGNSSEYSRRVERICKKHKDKIIFTGYIENNQLSSYYQIADIGIIPSTWEEGFGLVYIEQMASGLPTIATYSGALPEIGDKRTTLFVNKNEGLKDELRNAILTLKNNKKMCVDMSINGRKRSTLFSKQCFYRSFCEAINQTISI